LQVDLNIVAAFLAIVGYSLNDTVVIYDRIRENLRKYRKMEIVSLLNFSLNETLSRTIVTSLSIMLALAVLLILGHLYRHLFVDLYLRAGTGMAGPQARQLPQDRGGR
jgi:preprotein translocase SecF subunit